ncbi:MAG: hypothetical protein DMG72_05940 [Acidobacteria bacterium]|nr:MAG: hypothetical protein DMG72_05940 [Acidobacteriota bacterium]
MLTQLRDKGIRNFLALVPSIRRWSDRRKVVQLPLFPCCAFVHLDYFTDQRLFFALQE